MLCWVLPIVKFVFISSKFFVVLEMFFVFCVVSGVQGVQAVHVVLHFVVLFLHRNL